MTTPPNRPSDAWYVTRQAKFARILGLHGVQLAPEALDKLAGLHLRRTHQHTRLTGFLGALRPVRDIWTVRIAVGAEGRWWWYDWGHPYWGSWVDCMTELAYEADNKEIMPSSVTVNGGEVTVFRGDEVWAEVRKVVFEEVDPEQSAYWARHLGDIDDTNSPELGRRLQHAIGGEVIAHRDDDTETDAALGSRRPMFHTLDNYVHMLQREVQNLSGVPLGVDGAHDLLVANFATERWQRDWGWRHLAEAWAALPVHWPCVIAQAHGAPRWFRSWEDAVVALRTTVRNAGVPHQALTLSITDFDASCEPSIAVYTNPGQGNDNQEEPWRFMGGAASLTEREVDNRVPAECSIWAAALERTDEVHLYRTPDNPGFFSPRVPMPLEPALTTFFGLGLPWQQRLALIERRRRRSDESAGSRHSVIVGDYRFSLTGVANSDSTPEVSIARYQGSLLAPHLGGKCAFGWRAEGHQRDLQGYAGDAPLPLNEPKLVSRVAVDGSPAWWLVNADEACVCLGGITDYQAATLCSLLDGQVVPLNFNWACPVVMEIPAAPPAVKLSGPRKLSGTPLTRHLRRPSRLD